MTTEEGVYYLYNAILSVIALGKPLKLVISITTNKDLNLILNLLHLAKELYHIDSEVILRDKPLSQFQHIELLTQEQPLSDNDWVIFLDDDDMLLPHILDFLSPNINGFVGYQFIPLDKETEEILPGSINLSYKDLLPFIRTNISRMIFADDFSGTTIRFGYLKKFFESATWRRTKTPTSKSHTSTSELHTKMSELEARISQIIEPLSDTKLMSFLEKEVPNTPKLYEDPSIMPFVYHRIKGHPSLWQLQTGIY